MKLLSRMLTIAWRFLIALAQSVFYSVALFGGLYYFGFLVGQAWVFYPPWVSFALVGCLFLLIINTREIFR